MKKLLVAFASAVAFTAINPVIDTGGLIWQWNTKALGADLKAPPLPPAPVIASTPFYIGPFAGVSIAPIGSDTFFGGVEIGGSPNTSYPPGFLFGLNGGYGQNIGPIYWGIDLRAAYELQRNCSAFFCTAASNNAWLFQEAAELGYTFLLPGGPISSVTLIARGGAAEKTGNLGGLNGTADNTGLLTSFNSQLAVAPFGGLKVKLPITQRIDAFAGWDYIAWGNQGSYNASIGKDFSNSVAMKSENLLTAGVVWKF